MIVSAHASIESQHYFSFELADFLFNACFLHEYTSKTGIAALKKIITMDSVYESVRVRVRVSTRVPSRSFLIMVKSR